MGSREILEELPGPPGAVNIAPVSCDHHRSWCGQEGESWKDKVTWR